LPISLEFHRFMTYIDHLFLHIWHD
jgi:hypothetical protein